MPDLRSDLILKCEFFNERGSGVPGQKPSQQREGWEATTTSTHLIASPPRFKPKPHPWGWVLPTVMNENNNYLLYCTSATIPKSPFSPTSDLICCRLLPRMWWQKIWWAWQQSTHETLSLQQWTDQILWCDCCGSNLSFICFRLWQLHWDKEIKLSNYNLLVIAQEHGWRRGRKGEFSPSPTSHPTKSMQAGKSIAVKNISTVYCA